MAQHTLKAWPVYFRKVTTGEKQFEVRKNDRDFKAGDTITLIEWDAGAEMATGAQIDLKVGFTLYGPEFGIQEGYCVMSVTRTDTKIAITRGPQ